MEERCFKEVGMLATVAAAFVVVAVIIYVVYSVARGEKSLYVLPPYRLADLHQLSAPIFSEISLVIEQLSFKPLARHRASRFQLNCYNFLHPSLTPPLSPSELALFNSVNISGVTRRVPVLRHNP